MNKKELINHISNPKSIDRSAPFWAWNGKLDPKELKRQAHEMYEKGMGGFFMHSRVGLDTVYMSDEWLSGINACIEQAKEDGTNAWLYDEDRWPSGGAGGLVVGASRDYASKGMCIRVNDNDFKEVLCEYIATLKDNVLLDLRIKEKDEKKNEDEVYLYLGYDTTIDREWFNDTPGTDNINKDAVREFINSTYEKYKEEFGEHFGKEIPGVFTDEPNIDSSTSDYDRNDLLRLPWTYEFSKFFEEHRGYNYLADAPYLFFNGEKRKKMLHDYFRTMSEMFTQHFSKQIYDWCDDNNLLFTGHWLAENRMGSHVFLSGAIMPNYEYMHIPGIDLLRERTVEWMTVKMCTSVGNQLGKHRMLSEMYGVNGWQFSFEGQKWVGDYQFISGINMRCQHLTWYSMTGMRKRDYPPLFNYQTTWWEYNKIVEDYFARITAITSNGTPKRDVLVLYPLSSVWSNMKFERDDLKSDNMQNKMDEYGYYLNDFARLLQGQHYDFDFGDEEIMRKHAKVEDEQFIVGEASYKVVVVPKGCESIYKSTYKLMNKFLENGGKIIFLSKPTLIECEVNNMDDIFNNPNAIVVPNNKELLVELDKHLGRCVEVQDIYGMECTSIIYMLREYDDTRALYLINNDRHIKHKTVLTVDGAHVEELDLLSGKISPVNYTSEHGYIVLDVDFEPCDSKMYLISDEKQSVELIEDKPLEVITFLGPNCKCKRDSDNVLTLDMCKYSLNNEAYSEEKEVFMHQEDFRARLNMRSIKHNRGVQRYKWIYEGHENDNTPLKMEFKFNVIDIPSNASLVIEKSKSFKRVTLNGNEIKLERSGYFMDIEFDKIPIEGIVSGENTLLLEADYRNEYEFENIYVVGDFAVSKDREIIKETNVINFGDWTYQGYFHYPGSIIYNLEFENNNDYKEIIVDVPEFNATLIELFVNDVSAGYIPWKAKSKVNITEFVKNGKNKLDVKVVGSPKNMFGPFHLSNSDVDYYSSYTFAPDANEYTKGYRMFEYGITQQVYIYGK